jgi:hypothetical protein
MSWELSYSVKDMGYHVTINGKLVRDGETGDVALFNAPTNCQSADDAKIWQSQMQRTIARLSKTECKLT